MEFYTTINKNIYKVTLEGRTSSSDCQHVVQVARRFLDSTCDTLEFDFSKLDLLDSLGLSIILLVKNELEGKGDKHFVLKRPVGKVRHMFKNFNIDKIVEVKW